MNSKFIDFSKEQFEYKFFTNSKIPNQFQEFLRIFFATKTEITDDKLGYIENKIVEGFNDFKVNEATLLILSDILSIKLKFDLSFTEIEKKDFIEWVKKNLAIEEISSALVSLNSWKTKEKERIVNFNFDEGFNQLCQVLLENDCVDLGRIIEDEQFLVQSEKTSTSYENRNEIEDIDFWLIPHLGGIRKSEKVNFKKISFFLDKVSEQYFSQKITNERFVKISKGLLIKLRLLLQFYDISSGNFQSRDLEFSPISKSLQKYFYLIFEVWKEDSENEDLTFELIKFGRWAFWFSKDDLDSEIQKILVSESKKLFGKARVELRSVVQDSPKDIRLLNEPNLITETINLLIIFDGVWSPLKLLFLCLRHINTLTVTNTLRYWADIRLGEEPPSPWYQIPLMINGVIHRRLTDELEKDPELTNLRTEFSLFCLSKLKTKKGVDKNKKKFENEDFNEPNPIWREGYIRAIRSLKENPNRKSHHILYFARNNDPSESVRSVAKSAYKELRHQEGLQKMSPRRSLFFAFWWLRQAHFISLKGAENLDKAGAQRTYDKEVRWTTEQRKKFKQK